MGDRWGYGRSILLAVCAALALATVAGCGGGDAGTADTTSAASTSKALTTPAPTTVDTPDCKPAKPPKFESPTYEAPEQRVKRGEKLTAAVKTNCGTFEIALDAKLNRDIVNSFVFLSEEGFYDGLPFDRAAAGTYIEGGKPSGGAGGPGYTVEGRLPEGFIYRQGVIAMLQPSEAPAASRAGSQFFVSLAKPWIDMFGVYAPLGTVEKGLEVLEGISQFGPPQPPGTRNVGVIGTIGKLRRPVLIEKITIERD